MFEALRAIGTKDPAGVKLPPKIPFMKRDWTKTMQTLETKIQTLQSRFTTAERVHADACLLADEGGKKEAEARDVARAEFVEVEQDLANTRAALHAATRHKEIETEKQSKKVLAERQKRMAKLHKEVLAHCTTLDKLFDDVAVTALELRDKSKELRLQGVRDAQAAVINLQRTLGSHMYRSGITLGIVHPFDSSPLKLVDMCPELSSVLAVLEKKK